MQTSTRGLHFDFDQFDFVQTIILQYIFGAYYIMTTQTAVPFKVIRLNLARLKDFPKGAFRHGYEITAPLNREGH